MTSLLRTMVGLSLAATSISCRTTGDPVEPVPDSGAALTALPRALTPGEQTILSSANSFSFGLWTTINQSQRDSNVFISPLSVSFALGMTMNGAAGQTYDEMRSALRHGTLSLAGIDSGYKSLIALLVSLDPSTTMQIANSIFYRTGFPFNQSFLDDAAKWFDAEVKAQNFADAPGTLTAVNGWANDKTKGRIPKILDDVKSDDVMYLMNAIYFKGAWRQRFDPTETRDAPFHAATGGDQNARLMHRHGSMSYAETATFQAVDLAYGDSAFTMTVLLPKAGSNVESVAAALTPDSWSALTAGFSARDVNLYLPKVTFSWKRKLIDDMKAQGMRAAFEANNADFTRMSTSRGRELYMSLLQQNTFVAIDEVGTEAAAVTIGGITVTSAPIPVEMKVDRPYVFVIRERLSGTVLFMGKIARMPTT